MMKGSNMGEIMASSNACTKPAAAAATAAAAAALDQQKRARPQEQLNCPRCNSTNTKFCYYNNYSLTQPRYFCKTCRRYWTEGGTLRNVPVGGGSRKNRKPSTTSTCGNNSSIISKNTNMLIPDLNPPTNLFPGQDLNLAFPAMQQANNKFHYNFPTAKSENDNNMNLNHPRFFTSSSSLSFVTASGGAGDQAVIPPGSNTATFSSSGFQFPEFKPASALGFCSSGDGLGNSRTFVLVINRVELIALSSF
ncbi:hypothetical protein TIFTF001_012075 [Ficus carica]|uniref:Dof zinc finger protein n=1 Tax=Ficus carica TaxID=3494 RepID=A0AA87ZYD4_FICCA|nr:hypothetical protein TIFTF001_012075 [Ficus carica]